MADTTSLSALPQNNNVQSSENITLQTNDIVQSQQQSQQSQQSQLQPQSQSQQVQSTQPSQPSNIKQETPPTYSLPNTQQTAPPPQQLSQNVINQLITGIQQASKTGNTDLPSRDIPVDTARIVQDEEVKPNFVPKSETPDYIKNHESETSMNKSQIENEKINDGLDNLYNEIQAPLLIGVLFFLFQLPFFQKFIRKNFTSLYTNDGNINMYGYLFKALLFSGSFYGIQKGITKLSSI